MIQSNIVINKSPKMANYQDLALEASRTSKIHSEKVTHDTPVSVDLSSVEGNLFIKLGSVTLIFAPITDTTLPAIRSQAGDHQFVLLQDKSRETPSGTHEIDARFQFISPGETIAIGREKDTAQTFELTDDVSRQHATITIDESGRTLTVTDLNSTNGTNVSWQER